MEDVAELKTAAAWQRIIGIDLARVTMTPRTLPSLRLSNQVNRAIVTRCFRVGELDPGHAEPDGLLADEHEAEQLALEDLRSLRVAERHGRDFEAVDRREEVPLAPHEGNGVHVTRRLAARRAGERRWLSPACPPLHAIDWAGPGH